MVFQQAVTNELSARPLHAEGGLEPVVISDEELVDRINSGDQWAPRELVRRYQGKALSLAFSMSGGDRSEAEDLAQEAFLKVFRGLKGFKGKSSFHTWFHRVTVNACLDGLRKRRRREKMLSLWPLGNKDDGPSLEELPESSDQDQAHNPLTSLRSKELGKQVREALAELPEKQRLTFQLKVIQGLTIREVAEITGLAEGTVKSHLFRATRNLRESLGEWSEF